MRVVIMRGIPGAGKSHFVSKLFAEFRTAGKRANVVSADLSHTTGGVFKFDPAKKASAHNDCLRDALGSMQRHLLGRGSDDLLIVDNTNTTAWEIAPYYRLAEMFGHEVEIIRIHADFETACRRNVHEVPNSVIWALYQNLLTERLPSWWRETITFSN